MKSLKSLKEMSKEKWLIPKELDYDSAKTKKKYTLKRFVVPAENLPRYHYTYQNAKLMFEKYESIIRFYGRINEFVLPRFRDVNIAFFSGDLSVDISVVDISQSGNGQEFMFDSFKELLSDLELVKEKESLIIISTRNSTPNLHFPKPHIILVEGNKEKNKQLGEMHDVKESSREELVQNISLHLEDVIFNDFIKMSEKLEDIIQFEVHGASSTRHIAYVRDAQSEDKEQDNRRHHIPSEELQKVHDDAEELYEDILAMLYRSRKYVKSTFQNAVTTLDKEVASDLLKVPGVTSVGYKLARLSLFLDDSMATEKKQMTENNLKLLLKKHNISRYEFYYEQKELKKYAEVGSVLQVGGRRGALGGFATLGPQKILCVLLSRHVSLQGDSVLVEDPPKSEHFRRFATFISRAGPLDIAIAQVTNGPEYCQKQFKDEYGKCLPSSMCLFDDLKWLYRLPVHISRASNSTGLGIIIIPELAMEDAQGIYLKIEDRGPKERFANPGDSGAIICANDIEQGSKVHTIAMLIGSSNDQKADTNAQAKRQYVAFRLIKGIVQLQNELNEDVDLY